MKKAFPILGLLTAVLLSYALYEALVVAPTEATMGDVQRIFYYHVPSAWTAFLLFFLNFVASILYLTRRSANSDTIAKWTAIAIAVLSVASIPFLLRWFPPAQATSGAITGVIVVGVYFLMRRMLSHEGSDAFAVATAEVGVVF